METLIIIFKYLALVVGIVFLLVLLYGIIAGTIEVIINKKKAKEELDKTLDTFFADLKKAVEEEKSKKDVKKTKKSKKSE